MQQTQRIIDKLKEISEELHSLSKRIDKLEKKLPNTPMIET